MENRQYSGDFDSPLSIVLFGENRTDDQSRREDLLGP